VVEQPARTVANIAMLVVPALSIMRL
jgi:hypothetical protein